MDSVSPVSPQTDRSISQPDPVDKAAETAKMAKEFFDKQNRLAEDMKLQQQKFMATISSILPQDTSSPHSDRPPKRRRQDDDNISLHGNDSALSDGENDDGHESEMEDDSDLHRKKDELDDDEENPQDDQDEQIAKSRYGPMLDQVEEELGEPIGGPVAKTCKRTWNQAKLDSDKKKKMLDSKLIPSNCKFMKTKRPNTEIYIRMREVSRQKDQAAADRQTEVCKAVIPLLQILDKVEFAQKQLKKNKEQNAKLNRGVSKYEKAAYSALNDIDSLTMESYKVLNYFIMDTTRKRKFATCAGLGAGFSTFAGINDENSSEFLFSDEVMKKMKPDLKKLPIVPTQPKNGKGPRKSYGSRSSGSYGRWSETSRSRSSSSSSSRSESRQSHDSRRYNHSNRGSSTRGRGRGGR